MLAGVGRRALSKATSLSIASCSYSTATSPAVYEVTLSHLPSTVTQADIRNLCFKGELARGSSESTTAEKMPNTNDEIGLERFSKRTLIDYERLAISQDIIDIRLQRSTYLNFNGRATISFRTEQSASEYNRLAQFSIVGGSNIRSVLQYVAKGEPSNLPHSIKLLRQAQKESPGRVVLLKGLPHHLDADRLTRMLKATYSLAGDYSDTAKALNLHFRSSKNQVLPSVIKIQNLTPVESTSSFLVRLQTVSDAMRLVRRWHRAKWDHSSGLARVTSEMENDRKKRRDSYERTDQYENDLDHFEKSNTDVTESHDPKVEKLWKIPLIIDAILMY